MPSLQILYKEKTLDIPYKVEKKYGLVNYIIRSKDGLSLFYFRKYDGKDFHLAYGNMKEDLANAIIVAIEEIHEK